MRFAPTLIAAVVAGLPEVLRGVVLAFRSLTNRAQHRLTLGQ
jgi:hypothetical protein